MVIGRNVFDTLHCLHQMYFCLIFYLSVLSVVVAACRLISWSGIMTDKALSFTLMILRRDLMRFGRCFQSILTNCNCFLGILI